MYLKKILSKKENQYIIGGIAILGVGYYLYKKGKLPFLSKKYKMGYLTQGKLEGKDNDKAVAVHFANPRPKESEVAPNGKAVQTSDYVYISNTGVFDGKFKLRKKWTDKNGDLGAVWIGVTKKLGAQHPEKITDFVGKGRIELKSS
jgi:hypothetical protein